MWRLGRWTVRLLVAPFLLLALAYPVAWFALNSPDLLTRVLATVNGSLPGRIEVRELEWGPLPWRLHLTGVRILAPDDDQPVIRVDDLVVDLALADTLQSVVRLLAQGDGFYLPVDSVTMRGYSCTLTYDDRFDLRLKHAFVRPRPPGVDDEAGPAEPRRPGSGFTMDVRRVVGRGGRFRIDYPAWGASTEGIDLYAVFRIDQDGEPFVLASTVTSRRGEVRVGSGAEPTVFPFEDFEVHGYMLDHLFERIGSVRFTTEGARVLAAGHLATDDPWRWSELTAKVEVPPDAPALTRWVDPHVRPLAPVSFEWRLEGPLRQPDMAVAVGPLALASPWVPGRTTIEPFQATLAFRPEADVVTLPRLALAGDCLPSVEARDLSFGVDTLEVSGSLQAGTLSRALWPLAWPAMLEAVKKAGGSVRVSGQLPLGPVSGRRLELDADLDLGASRGLRGRAAWEPGRFELNDLRLATDVGEASATGWIEPDSGQLDLRSTGAVRDLARFAERLRLPVVASGGAEWTAEVRGAWTRPEASVSLAAQRLRVAGVEVGTVRTRAALRDRSVHVAHLSAAGPLATLSTRGRLDLGDDWRPRRVRLDEVTTTLEEPAALLSGLPLTARLELAGRDVDLDLDAPLASLRGDLDLSIRGLTWMGEPIDELVAAVHAPRGAPLRVDKLEVRRKGKRLLAGQLRLDRALDELSGAASISARLSDLPFLHDLPFPMAADVALSLSVDGTPSDPLIQGVLRLDDWQVRPRAGLLARGQTATVRVWGRPSTGLHLSSDDLYPGVRLDPLTTLHPDGFDFFLELDGLEPAALAEQRPELPVALSVSGSLRASGRPADPSSVTVLGRIPRRGLRLSLQDDELTLWNEEETVFGVSPLGVFLNRFRLTGQSIEAALCGEIGADGALDVAASIEADVTALPGLNEFLTEHGGLLHTEGAGNVPSCLPGTGGIHLEGTLERPRFSGALVLEDLALRPRGFGGTIQVPGRARLLVTQEGEETWVRVDPTAPLKGVLDDGAFEIAGQARFQRFAFVEGQVSVTGSNVAYAVPGVTEFAANPRLTFTAHPQDDDPYVLSGDVRFVSGLFYKDFDQLRQMVSGVLGERRASAYSRPLDELLPFLKRLRFDVRLRGQNYDVRCRLPFGETDLSLSVDLRLGGTWSAPELYDRVEIVPGSMVTYQLVKRDFEVTHGTLDFSGDLGRPEVDLRAKTDIDVLVRAGTSGATTTAWVDTDREETVTLVLALSGVPPDLRFDLSSNRTEFDQEDLQYLLLTGQPKQAGGGLMSGVSLNLLAQDLVKSLSSYILAPFLDRVSFGFTAEGGVNADLMTKLGRRVQLRTRILQQGTDVRYSAGFTLKLGDRLSLDGRMKAIETEGFQSRTYEAKLRYRIEVD